MSSKQIRTRTDPAGERTSATQPASVEITAEPNATEQIFLKVNETEQGMTAEQPNHERTFTRRVLLKAGWVAPVILAVGIPQTPEALAQSAGVHMDTHRVAHTDMGRAFDHNDVLSDPNNPSVTHLDTSINHTDRPGGGTGNTPDHNDSHA